MRSRLQDLAREAVRARDGHDHEELDKRCRELLAELRERCPHLLPPEPLKPGQPGPALEIDPKSLQELFHEALRPTRDAEVLLWHDGDNELLVEVAAVRIRVADGLVMVEIPVACDQVDRAVVHVPFAVGSRRREAGLVVATEARPRGPVEIIELWGEALIALAWRSLLEVTAALARESGQDLDGAGLIPVALSASREGLKLQTLARHGFDRVAAGGGRTPSRDGRS